MASKSSDDGAQALGRHARTIHLGRALWQSPPLDAHVASSMQERMFDDGTFPPLAEARKAVAQAKKPDEQRPPPFAGKTQPFAHLSVVDYGNRLNDWLEAVNREEEAPTTEQFDLITRVKDRVLQEIR